MYSSYENVKRAITFQTPDRLPVIFPEYGNTDCVNVWWNQIGAGDSSKKQTLDEWGCTWSRSEVRNMGIVTGHPLADWDDLEHFHWPDPDDEAFYTGMEKRFAGCEGKYVRTSIFGLLFERMHYLHGFENTLMDLYLEREKLEMLADRIVDFDIGVIRNISKRFPGKIHGLDFSDDWGTERATFISCDMFRDFFMPRYKKIFDACKEAGWDVWMHSCGKINDFLPMLIECGVNVLNMLQPCTNGIREIGERYAGKVCFYTCCDIQKTLVRGTYEEIEQEAADLIQWWGTEKGGFILSDYGDDAAIGCSVERKKVMYDAFLKHDRWRKNRAEAVRRCNIVFDQWNGERKVGCYLGNGRFGAIMSGLGLNLTPEQKERNLYNPSHYNHMSHWGRFRFFSKHMKDESCGDYILPFYSLYWKNELDGITGYRQCHDLYDGVLYTEFAKDSGTLIHVKTWFDGVNRDIAGVQIDVNGSMDYESKIELSAPTLIDPCWFYCDNKYTQSVSVERIGEEWEMTVTCDGTSNNSSTKLCISTNMEVEISDTGFLFTVKPGTNQLLMSVNTCVAGETAEVSLKRTKEYWHKTWQEIGWIEYPDEQMQKVLIRGMAYLLSSYDADGEMVPPPNSMGIGGFAYNFVPDMENVAPVLLMMGRLDIVKHWVEFFAERIEDMRQYAKHLWPEAEGIFPPWELNYGPIEGYHSPSLPVIFCYEAHNTGYLCRLAMEATEFINDEEWAKTYAYPLIDGCAKFFRTFCFKEDDGLWHLKWYPCMGRDEAGGVNKEDYLCTLFTAKYSFQSAIRCGLDEGCDYQQILDEGLAFESLLSERGTLHTCRGADDFGIQKHPVQLEGITCFPMEPAPYPVEEEAYKLRHDITADARIPKFYGWTLAQLLIADTNMKKFEEWEYDWNLLRPSDIVDENWIQFYENTGNAGYPFYTATHGMVMQSLIRNCVNDYWGRLEIGSCLPKDIVVQFDEIRTRLGVSLNGKIEHGRFTGSVTALRDCDVLIGEQRLIMKTGESKELQMII